MSAPKTAQQTLPAPTQSATTTAQTPAPEAAATQGGALAAQGRPSQGASQFHQQQQQASPAVTPKAAPAEEKNEAAAGPVAAPAEEKKEDASVPALRASGLANYEATLGKWLGGQLYGAVSRELTLDKLSSHANSALRGAIRGLGGKIKDLDQDVDPGQVNQAVDAAIAQFGQVAGNWVKANGGGLSKALQGWADANPEAIVTLALLAAAGAVAANMEIPELAGAIGLGGGLEAGVAVKLGRLRDITLQRVEGRLTYQAKQLTATFRGTYEEGKSGVGLDLRSQLSPDLDLTGQAGWNQEGGANARVGLNYKPRKDLDIGAHVGYDQRQGANVGVGVTFRF
jgi:hypothetical protein